MSRVDGSQLFDGCRIFVVADQENNLRVRLWPKTDLKGHTVSCRSKFEAQHMPNPAAARDGSYLAAPEQPVRLHFV
jgi:hypothetical protein